MEDTGMRFPSGLSLAGITLFWAWPVAAETSDVFFRGKQINIIVSTGTGGGYSEYAQLFAQFFGRHIEGSPAIVAQYMPGAGGLRATNYLFNSAPKDGTTLGIVFGTMVTADIFSPVEAIFKSSDFNWIGNMDGESANCVTWHTSKTKTFADMQSRETLVGSAGLGGSFDKHPRLLNNVAGTKLKVIQGYKNGNEINLAMERGEVEGRCGWPMTSIVATKGEWLAEKKLNFVLQVGMRKHPDLPNVPLIVDLISDADERSAVELAIAERELQRPVVAPPGVPAERVAVLRRAFMSTMNDPEFLTEITKRKLTISAISGADVQKMIEQLNSSPAHVKERAALLLAASTGESK
jgi:tripartite-type tricarboxylate transporter receptor subunit TctC